VKAVVQNEYGPPEGVLEFTEIDAPVVGPDGVLVRVRAASVHVGDWATVRGIPYIMRPAIGLRRPKHRVPGSDVAGVVEAVGPHVSRFEPGAEVFGWCNGAFAEYACAAADHFVLKPPDLSFEEAASVGVSAFAALQALRDQGKVQAGQKVLINGASGGVGTFAVQIAKSLGADVTGVCSTGNVEMVRSLGADRVIDYTQEDFTQDGQRYDFILDNVGNRSSADFKRVLAPDGVVLPNSGAHAQGRWFGATGRVARDFVASLFARQQGRPFLSMPSPEDLAALRELVATGAVTPVVDRTFPLDSTADAIGYVGEGHARGKVVVSV